MKKQFLWTAACAAGVVAMAMAAGNGENEPVQQVKLKATSEATDITSQYLTNPSFEADDTSTLTEVTNNGLRGWTCNNPTGWTLTSAANPNLIVTADCYADNNLGQFTTIADGKQAFYMRMGWSTGTSKLSQTVTLPAGKYRLTAAVRSLYVNSASSTYSLSAGGENSATTTFSNGTTFPNLAWGTASVEFETSTEGNVTLALNVDWLSGGSCITVDDFRLFDISNESGNDTPVEIPTENDVTSVTEGVITHDFVNEADMKADILQMLADFSKYMKDDFQECTAPNSVNEACGCFKGENTMGNNEQGVRPNADLSMICAFLVKYGKDKVTLPDGVTWDDLETMAMKSLVFSYSTHKANKLKVCSGNNYWGSTSTSDSVWESSLWAMSVAYSAYFQWDKLTDTQKGYIEAMMKAECNYELYRSIPTGYQGDTKAEENGWEADILAATLGLFPNDELAPKWFARLREFAINSYSHPNDASDNTVIDPDYDTTTVADLYKGQNLYDDYTLQNHNLFHTSYQNVVMQELGEAALALKMFQKGLYGTEKWQTNALMHNNQKVMDEVLNWLALADGELAMPNGNDWSLFLYDQITSYTTMACFLNDANSLMLENMAYKYIKARQKTTTDGSWLLRADVGARRMGVEGHRVMMTWLMHEMLSTANLTPTTWEDFNAAYSEAKVLTAQNVVRASTPDRFTCFSWSSGLSSYTGYYAPNTPDNNKIIIPYRANNTGNILGWYTVNGKSTNATPVVSGIYNLNGDAYTMNGEINTNDASLNNRFALYSTPGNALIYIDYVRANSAVTITGEYGGLLAISTDPFMKETRTFYYGDGKHVQSNGETALSLTSNWVNIDNTVGMVSISDKKIGFGNSGTNNSIKYARLYNSYSTESRSVASGDVVDKRHVVYYSNVNAETTKALTEQTQPLADKVPTGWNGIIAPDPDGTQYLILSNFVSDQACELADITCAEGAPVFNVPTSISADGKSSATFRVDINNSISNVLKVFVSGAELLAMQDTDNDEVAYLQNDGLVSATANVTIIAGGNKVSGTATIGAGSCVKVSVANGALVVENGEMPEPSQDDDLSVGYTDVTSKYLSNPNFEADKTYSEIGSVTITNGTYDPCYINTAVSPIDSKFENILPVQGWTAGNALEGDGSAYCRMYSMPYSTTMYCVSKNGNYADQCAAYIMDENVGARCLTVLNSWAAGTNRITQSVSLPAGKYRLLMDVKYLCPNEAVNNVSTITAGANINTSYTGLKIGNNTDYRYPSEKGVWKVMNWDFELDATTTVELSAGYATSAAVGVANQTLLYIDNIRLLTAASSTKIDGVYTHPTSAVDVYSLTGIRLRSNVAPENATNGLLPGIYVVGGKKVAVK